MKKLLLLKWFMKYLMGGFLIILIIIISTCSFIFYTSEPNEPYDNSIENNERLRNKISNEISLGQVEAFGFKLEEKYETEYLIGVEDGFVDMVFINIYQVKDSHIELIRDLFRKNVKYVEKNTWNICSGNRYSKKAVANNKTEIYYDSYCGKGERNGDNNVSAECIVFSKFEDAIDGEGRKHEICLFDKYLQFYYGEM